MNMNNLKGFVFYVDILGFSALTQVKSSLQKTILIFGRSLNIFRLQGIRNLQPIF